MKLKVFRKALKGQEEGRFPILAGMETSMLLYFAN